MTPIVEAAKNPIPLQLPDAPLDLDAAEGDTIALVSIVLNNTYTNAIKDGLEAAADAAGASVDVFDAQGSVNQAAAGIDQAIARGVDGIVLVSVGRRTRRPFS